jgi:hypothetical protein
MQQARQQPRQPSHRSDLGEGSADIRAHLQLWRLNLLRVGFFVLGIGIAVTRWPLLFDHESWELKEGTVVCMLVAMSVLALLGLRYPTRMLPILLFEVGWKLTWLAVVALPLWADGRLEGATREQAGSVLWVVIIIAVIPWRHVLNQYVIADGEPWRRRRFVPPSRGP